MMTKKNIEQALRLKEALERAHAKIVFPTDKAENNNAHPAAAIELRRAQETIAQLKDQLNYERRLTREFADQRDALEKENAELRRRLGELMKFAPAEALTEAETEA